MENRALGYSNTVVIHVRTNDVRRTRNLDCVMGELYDLVNMEKTKFPASILVLSDVLSSKSVTWRRVGAANETRSVTNNLGATFVYPNS
jgi:hypothetical protein